MDLRKKTSCFTGHRSLNGEEKLKVAVRLREIIAEQIKTVHGTARVVSPCSKAVWLV